MTELSLPVYQRIENDLRGRIRGGVWRTGTMLPSRKDLAKEYSVDLGTVQRAVAGLLADGTLRADGGRGTFVTDAGGSPRAPAARMVALILDQSFHPTDPGAQATPRAFGQALRAEDAEYRLLTFDTHGETPAEIVERERHALTAVENEEMAGVLLWHSGGPHTQTQISHLMARGLPLIFMDRYPDGLECDFVGVDNEYSAREATNYLLSLGHRRIAFLAPSERVTTIEQRLAGYERALGAAGIPVPADLICRLPYTLSLTPDSLRQQLQVTVAALTALPDPPTAVFAVNDFLAHHFVAAAEEFGLSVPQNVSVMGFDDIERYSPRTPFLTTMQQPFEAIGERAADLLLSRLQTPEASRRVFQHVLLPTRLVVRRSCRRLG